MEADMELSLSQVLQQWDQVPASGTDTHRTSEVVLISFAIRENSCDTHS